MATVDEFSRVVAAVYAAVLDPAHWVAALAEISLVLDALGAALITPKSAGRVVEAASIPLPAQQAYGEYYHTIDYVLDALETGPVGVVHDGAALVAMEKGSEFDADFMRPNQLRDGLFVRLAAVSTPSFLVVGPDRDVAFYTPDSVAFITALIPHLHQALRIQGQLGRSMQDAVDLAGLVSALQNGIVIVGVNGEVVRINSAAIHITRAADGLLIRTGTLCANSHLVDRDLRQGIGAAICPGAAGAVHGSSLICPRPSGQRAYVVHVLPLNPAPGERPTGHALVIVVDPEQHPVPPAALLRRLYGLTRTEAEIALRLSRGDGVKPVADELTVSLPTVKTHLQHIFDKTDTHRQAELVRLLLRILP